MNFVVKLPWLPCFSDTVQDPHLVFSFLFRSCQSVLGHTFRFRHRPKQVDRFFLLDLYNFKEKLVKFYNNQLQTLPYLNSFVFGFLL